jgi:hypothetical protein
VTVCVGGELKNILKFYFKNILRLAVSKYLKKILILKLYETEFILNYYKITESFKTNLRLCQICNFDMFEVKDLPVGKTKKLLFALNQKKF